MKRKIVSLMVATAIIGITTASAQFQLSANGSYLKGTGDNSAHLWGGGLSAKYLVGHTVSVGVGFNTFPKTTSTNVDGTNYSYTNANTQAFANLDIMLGGSTSIFQPYIGANVGASINTHTYSATSSSTVSSTTTNDKTYFYLAPLVGFNIGLGKQFGLFAQGSYGLTFGSGDNNNVSIPNSTAKPVDKFFQADAGVYVRF